MRTRVRAPVDVATAVRYRAVRRDVDAHDGRTWQVRLELDLDDSSLVEVAEELLTSGNLGAQVVTGRGSVLMLTAEQIGWLHHKLGVLLRRGMLPAEHETVGSVSKIDRPGSRLGAPRFAWV